MRAARQQMQLSAQPYHYVLKLARTIANLVMEEPIATTHLVEARQYQPKSQLM